MSLIFISHSSKNNAHAMAMRDWLNAEGWDDVFLDLDPSIGLSPGQHWREELRKAGERCSAVVVLVSPQWADSKWCQTEFLFAAQLGKEIFPVLVEPCSFKDLPIELTATYQFADISTTEIRAEGYEQLRIGLQRAGLHPGAFPWPPKNEPNRPLFRGLKALDEQDAAIFFGRDTQITKALDTIRRLRDGAPERMLVILGASGAGKSSFLRAGLLSRLKRDTERFLVLPTLRPGRASLTGETGLQSALGLDGPLNDSAIAAHLTKLREPVLENLRRHAPQTELVKVLPPTVVLPIDQAEELLVVDNDEAATVTSLISEAVKADSNFLLLLTIRSDSLGLLQGEPHLSGISKQPFELPRLPVASFKEVIEGPTRLPGAGIKIDPELTDQLILDFEGGDALPLLAFTLERLVADHAEDGHLKYNDYINDMKGVGGAIRAAVERAFAKAAEISGLPQGRAALDELAQRCFIPGLVYMDDAADVPKRRLVLRGDLPRESLPLIDSLADERLLITDATGTEPTVEVSHEAVIRHWRELAAWIAERRDDLSLSERVTSAARDWQDADGSSKAETLVYRGERLRAAEKLLSWDNLGWKKDDYRIAFISACRDAETQSEVVKAAQQLRQIRLQNWVKLMITFAALVTSIGAVLVASGQRNLSRAESLTLARTAEQYITESDYIRASRLAILAAHNNALKPASQEARAILSSAGQGNRLMLEFKGHENSIYGSIKTKDWHHILIRGADNTVQLWDAVTGTQIGTPLTHEGSVTGAIFSKNEDRILTWSEDNTARLWDAVTGTQIAPPLTHEGSVTGAIFSKDEDRILTWSADNTARLWDAITGTLIGPPLTHEGSVIGALFSPDGSRILTQSLDNTIRLWDVATSAQIGPPLSDNGLIRGTVFSSDGSRILTWSKDNTTRQWDAVTGAQIGPQLTHRQVRVAFFSPDESRILTQSLDNSIRLWDVATGVQIGPQLTHDEWIQDSAMFTKDGERFLTWSGYNVALWGAATGTQIGPPLTHDQLVLGAIFSPNEDSILTWSWDNTVRLWDVVSGAQIGPPLTHDGWVKGAVFSKDGGYILTWSREDNTARLWDTVTGSQIGPPLTHDGFLTGANFLPDENRILTWSEDNTFRLWNIAIGTRIDPLLTHGRVRGAVFSPNEDSILTWSADNTVRLWDAVSGAQIGPPLTHDDLVRGAVFSKDGDRILTWSEDNTTRLWNAVTGTQIGTPLTHEGSVTGTIFSKNADRILTWNEDNTARLWDAVTGAQIGPPLTHDDSVRGAVFSKDGDRILTWSEDNTTRLWNAVTCAQIGPPLTHDQWVRGAIFSPDEDRILTWGSDIAWLWDAATGAQIDQPLTHVGLVSGAAFSPDGNRIFTWGLDDTSWMWDATTGTQISPPLTHNQWLSSGVFSKDGGYLLAWGSSYAALWDTTTGTQISPPLTHDGSLTGAAFSPDENRILTWGRDNTARLWDAATGIQIGPPLTHEGSVIGAVFSNDMRRILTWSQDDTAWLWDVEWALSNMTSSEYIEELCRKKLVGASFTAPPSDWKLQEGVRHIDTLDTANAPILRGREGEDVCAPPPTTLETLLSLLRLPFE